MQRTDHRVFEQEATQNIIQALDDGFQDFEGIPEAL